MLQKRGDKNVGFIIGGTLYTPHIYQTLLGTIFFPDKTVIILPTRSQNFVSTIRRPLHPRHL